MPIPVCEPLLCGRELEYVTNCLKGNWISSRGHYVDEFESRFARYCGCEHGISTTSGTTALHLALAALKIGSGDEVIVPAFTMAATVFAVLYTGATPVLVDADPETWTMDVRQIEAKVTSRTRAAVPVHIYGQPCDMDSIVAMAERYGFDIIEDAAEAHGAEYHGKKVGSFGRMGCFSFYANKIITTGEGGMVVTNDEEVADLARRLRDGGHSTEERFLHSHVGFNYRMTNIQAAIGLAQMEQVNELVEMRRRNAHRYDKLLRDVPGVTLPSEGPSVKNVHWMYGILVEESEFGLSRDALMAALAREGVETRRFFHPMHRQPAFLDLGLFEGEDYPVADMLSERGLYLPSGSGLSETQIGQVCHSLKKAQRQRFAV